MKNIHVLPTDKPSRFYKRNSDSSFDFSTSLYPEIGNSKNQNIYITSDEEIKENGYGLIGGKVGKIILTEDGYEFLVGIGVSYQYGDYHSLQKVCKKIILTTDVQLIQDGVQAIDDEFLQWFVINPSWAYVVVKYQYWKEINDVGKYTYKIIIPKPTQQIIDEDFDGGLTMGEIMPKEETTQESYICPHTKSQCYDECCVSAEDCHIKAQISILSNAPITKIGAIAAGLCEHLEAKEQSMFIAGFQECAKWMQQEQRYNEEDVKNAFLDGWQLRDGDLPFPKAKKKWFNKFKNK